MRKFFIGKPIFVLMNLPMRITFEGMDYSYVVLTKSINRQTTMISIRLQGMDYELTPDQKGKWNLTDSTVSDRQELLRAIAKSIILRYAL